MNKLGFALLCILVCPMHLLTRSAQSMAQDKSLSVEAQLLRPLVSGPAQQKECSRRMGPYATQSTAWQRWRQAKSQGYRVSNGIFPCYENRTRGYCFNVFFPCPE